MALPSAARFLAAAEAALVGGSPQLARTLLDRSDADVVDAALRSRALVLAADIAVQTGEPLAFSRGAATCLDVARPFDGRRSEVADEALLHACGFAINAEYAIHGDDSGRAR